MSKDVYRCEEVDPVVAQLQEELALERKMREAANASLLLAQDEIKRLKELCSQITDGRTYNAELASEYHAENKKLTEQIRELEDLHIDAENRVTDLQAEIKRLKEQVADLKSELGKMSDFELGEF